MKGRESGHQLDFETHVSEIRRLGEEVISHISLTEREVESRQTQIELMEQSGIDKMKSLIPLSDAQKRLAETRKWKAKMENDAPRRYTCA